MRRNWLQYDASLLRVSKTRMQFSFWNEQYSIKSWERVVKERCPVFGSCHTIGCILSKLRFNIHTNKCLAAGPWLLRVPESPGHFAAQSAWLCCLGLHAQCCDSPSSLRANSVFATGRGIQNKTKTKWTHTHTKMKTTKEKRPGAVRERLCRNHGATACKLQSCQCWGDWRQTLERASVFKQCWLGAEDTVFKYASPCVLGAVYSHLEPEPRSSKRAATCFCCLFSLNTPECMSCGYKWRIDFFFPLLFWIFS